LSPRSERICFFRAPRARRPTPASSRASIRQNKKRFHRAYPTKLERADRASAFISRARPILLQRGDANIVKDDSKVYMKDIEHRVERVRDALVAYGLETPGYVVAKDMIDLLVDIRHYFDFIGKDFDMFDKRAELQYREEKGPIQFG